MFHISNIYQNYFVTKLEEKSLKKKKKKKVKKKKLKTNAEKLITNKTIITYKNDSGQSEQD